MKYRKKPVVIEAVRYGKDFDGSWYPGSVQRVAAFMLGLDADAELRDVDCMAVVQPTVPWDPPEDGDLTMWDGVAHQKWLPLAVGDYVIKGVQGEFYPCKPDIFEQSYEEVL